MSENKQQPSKDELDEGLQKTEAPPSLIDLLASIDPNLVGLAGSLTAFAAGAALLLDDATDLGKFDTPDHPSPFHHWIYGALLMVGGVAGMGVTTLNLLASNPDAVKHMRDQMQEAHFIRKAVPPEALEKLLREKMF